MKIYLLTAGYLDDFQICSAYPSRAGAELAAKDKGMREGDYEVQEIDLTEHPAIVHLKSLLDSGFEHAVGMCDDRHCFHCGAWLDEGKYRDKDAPDHHEPDCPYLAALAFVESLTQTAP